jgi:ADP-ribose pyrophosphatase YjhB (NUDIX family)
MPREYPEAPVVGVGAVILVEGAVLLVKRGRPPMAGQWTLPGGTVEAGETLDAALIREVREETGLHIDVGPVLEVFDRIERDAAGRVRFHHVIIDYLCHATGGGLRAADDAEAVALADPKNLESWGLTPKALEVIARAMQIVDQP